MYRFIPAEEDNIGRASKTDKAEVVTRFNFMPSWWLTKLGMSRAMEVISRNSTTQGWQYQLRTFNVSFHNDWHVSSNSGSMNEDAIDEA